MLRAVYVRRLKTGVTDDEYIAAWMPEGADRADYPARATVNHASTDERLTFTVFELDVPQERFVEALPSLVRPDWRERVDAVVEETLVETVFEETVAYGRVGAPGSSGGSQAPGGTSHA